MHVVTALTHIFIPQESNKHKASILKTPVLLTMLALFVISQYGIRTVTPDILGYASQISTKEVIRLTNIKRAEAGLSTLTENSALDEAAKAKGLDMLAKGYWAHVAPDGTQPWDFFKNVGYKYRFAGENLARDFTNPNSAVEAWMASPSHKENLLSPKYKEIGVAVVDGSLNGKDATIIVQLFGATGSDTPQLPVAAASEKQVASVASEQTQPEPAKANVITPLDPSSFEIANVSRSTTSTPFFENQTKLFSFAVVGLIFFALVLDSIVLWLKGRRHGTGKSLAQIAFLGMILALIVVAKAGQII